MSNAKPINKNSKTPPSAGEEIGVRPGYNPDSYQDSPLGPIPVDWEIKELKDEIESLETGVSVNSVDEEIQNGDLCILKTSAISDGIFYKNECKKIRFEEIKRAKLNPQKDSIIISRMNTPDLVGECGYIPQTFPNLFLPDRLWQTRFYENSDINVKWLNFLLNTPEYKLKIKSTATGTSNSMKNISKESLLSIKIPYPPKREMDAIANLLSTWDKAIQTTTALIAQKEQGKKWLMQQLLTGKKRLKGFDGKWKINSLDKFISPIVREIEKPKVPYLALGIRSHGKGTFLKYNEEPGKNSMDYLYVVRKNDLIVNITFAWEMAIAIVGEKDDGALVSHRFPTYTFKENKGHPDFFRFFILQPKMKYVLDLISPGGAGRNRVLDKSDFLKLEFPIAEYEEQIAIATVLRASDKEIQVLKAKMESLKEQKKGLMQMLLTGKKRLKIK